MLNIHTADGQTHHVDLRNTTQAREWLTRLGREDFQASICGVTLVEQHFVRVKCEACGATSGREVGVQYSISRPDDVRRVFVHVERVERNGSKGGERVVLFADDVRLTLMAHASQPASRVTIDKIGKQAFNALKERRQ